MLRRATPEDVDAMLGIERASFSDPWSRYAIATSIESPMLAVTVAQRTSREAGVVGYSILARAADEVELLNLAVVEPERGKGIGRVLLQRAVDDARGWGARAVFLEVRDSNHIARRLYERAGFSEVGRRLRYYRHPSEDALILRRLLD